MSIRKSANAGINAGMLVFIGSMCVSVINKFLDNWAVSLERAPKTPAEDTPAVVD